MGGKASAGWTYSAKDGDVAANKVEALFRLDRRICATTFAFLQTTYERDPLAELDRRVAVTGGVGKTFVDDARNTLKGEVGVGATFEARTGLAETTHPSGWVGAEWEHRFAEARKLRARFDFRPDLSDVGLSKSTLKLSYSTPCFSVFDLEVALKLEDVIDPPGDVKPLDLSFTVGLDVEM